MSVSRRGLALLLAVAGPALLPVSAAPAPAFRTDDPRFARLYALEEKADALFESDDYALSMSQQTRDAWVALETAASHSKVQGQTHPLAGVALINLSSMDQIDGRNPDALAHAERGLALLSPFRDAYPIYWMQGLSIKGYVQVTLNQVGAGVETLAEASRFIDGYFARTPPKALDESAMMLKSNIAFAHAQALSRLGRNAEAVEAQRRSMEARVAASGQNSADAVGAYYMYSQMLSRADRDAEAEIYARLAVDTATDHVDRKHPNYARALEALGLLLSRTGRRTESLDYLERSIAIKRETIGTKSLYFHFALQNLGNLLLPLERYDEAEPLFLEAERGFRAIEGDNSPQSARALAFAGVAAAAQGHDAVAIERLQTALTRVRSGDSDEREMGQRIYPFLIPALIESGRLDEARTAAADYAAQTRQLDNMPGFAIANAGMLSAWANGGDTVDAACRMIAVLRTSVSLQDGLDEDQRAALDTVLTIAARAQDSSLALDAMSILAGSRIAEANRLVAQRMVDNPALAGRVRDLQDDSRALQAADSALLKALAIDQEVDAARRNRATIANRVASERTAMARDYPRWIEARGAVHPDLATLRAGLAKDEAVLAVMPAFGHVYLLAVGRDRSAIVHTQDSRAALVAMIDRLRLSMSATGFDQDGAHALYRALFPADILAILGQAHSLRIVPTGAFASLPFAMLPQQPVRQVDSRTPWLVRRFALEIETGFSTKASQRLAAHAGHLLGVGAPAPFPSADDQPAGKPALLAAGQYYRGGAADITALSRLPSLPGSAQELRAVARRFGPDRTTLLIGKEASEATLRDADLSRYSVMLFATHGLVSGQMDGLTEPALVLSPPAPDSKDDGLLTASEVAQMRIGADWVILSACNTAAGNMVQAPAYSGLAQAFRYAGAGSLLVSHWPVRDDAGAIITLETIKASRNGRSRPVALQRAMLKLIRSGKPDAVQPYVWAPFILVGQ
ncbi:CHAT domain-containing protein [Sphingobium sp. AP49]|uniref:CHAT domain-containing protein n=1 Tax=Sphingobium sp. AP49 TaxID=1144307 RepID=UPI00026EC905|nr:CHAT domain-containing tetratricopeptide repeat protein [Sphingobium sp. AP49]WHO38232.1 CHAT domain-containing protein [Sphingobium sp. AP49]